MRSLTLALVATALAGCGSATSPLESWLDKVDVLETVQLTQMAYASPDGFPLLITTAFLQGEDNLLVADGASGTLLSCTVTQAWCEGTGVPTMRPGPPTGISIGASDTLLAWTGDRLLRITTGEGAGSTVLRDSLNLQKPVAGINGVLDLPWATPIHKPTAVAPDARGEPVVSISWTGENADTILWIPQRVSEWTLTTGAKNRVSVAGVDGDSVLVIQAATAEVAWASKKTLHAWVPIFPGSRAAKEPSVIQDPLSRQIVIDEHPLVDNATLVDGRSLVVVANLDVRVRRPRWYAPRQFAIIAEQALVFFDVKDGFRACGALRLPPGKWRLLSSKLPDRVPMLYQANIARDGTKMFLASLRRPSACSSLSGK